MANDYSTPLSKKIIALLVMITILFVVVGVLAVSWIRSQKFNQVIENTPPISLAPPKLDADKIEVLVNDERAKNGLAPLAHSDLLRTSACAKLDDMVTNNYWSHVSPNGTQPWYFFTVVGYTYTYAGENLAYGQNTESALITDWMNSQTHKDNILGNYAESGVCTKTEMYQGWIQTVTVHHFGTR
jgi:uncharacterized protein YkwD